MAEKLAITVHDLPGGDSTPAKLNPDAPTIINVKPKKYVRTRVPFFSVKCLTGLRGVAALGVVAAHMFSGDGAKIFLNGWKALADMGTIAVIFFFVLSAFLLTVRPLTEQQKPADAKYVKWSENGILLPWLSVRWIKYLIRRVFRILPLYWLVLVISAVVPQLSVAYADLRNGASFDLKTMAKWMFFVDVNSIFWTIPPEFEYYLVMPVFIVLYEMAERKDKLGEWIQGIKPNPPFYPYGLGSVEIEMKEHLQKGLHNRVLHIYYRFGRRMLLLLALSLFNCLVAPLFWSAHGAYDYYHLPPFIKRFWLGSFAAFFYHMCAQYGYVIYDMKGESVDQKFSKKATKWISFAGDLVCWFLIIFLFLSFPWYRRKLLGHYVPEEPLTYYADNMGDWPVLGAALMCFVVCAFSRNGSFSHFFEWSVFTFAGEISFPLYLTHPPVIHFILDKKIVGIDGLIFCYLLCFIIAAALHYIVEKPMAKIATKLARYIQTRYFSKDPKQAVDHDKHEELQVKKYNEMGLTMAKGDTFADATRPANSEGNTVAARFSVIAPLGNTVNRPFDKPAPLVQILHMKTDVDEKSVDANDDTRPLSAMSNLRPRNEEDEAPLASLSATRTSVRQFMSPQPVRLGMSPGPMNYASTARYSLPPGSDERPTYRNSNYSNVGPLDQTASTLGGTHMSQYPYGYQQQDQNMRPVSWMNARSPLPRHERDSLHRQPQDMEAYHRHQQ
ncbi:acyltransferase family-domain-containing protein [Phlyctochytrium arcticum]|nr:acyltransferase family-domain-containing protein [Phlyctochytrium arcticum]